MTRSWTIGMRGEQHVLSIYEHGLQNSLKLALHEIVDAFDDKVTDHRFCGERLPEFLWQLPVGFRQRDPENPTYPKNSVASVIYDTYSKFTLWAFAVQDRDHVATVNITEEQYNALDRFFSAEADED